MKTRRELLVSAAAGGVLGLLPRNVAAGDVAAPKEEAKAAKTMLVLGGTAFLGPEVVAEAKGLGYRITLFNRGKTNPGMFPDLEKLRGDRDGDLKALEGRTWDVVVDTSGYFPKQVRASAGLLAKSTKHYVFVSSISVFDDTSRPGLDESSPVGRLPAGTDPDSLTKITGGSYGPLKALCEEAAEKAMPGRVLNVRPGLIVGPGDRSDRFTYWPVRVARGGAVLAPGAPTDPIQIIDVRDLAAWIVRAADERVAGVFNATGPKDVLTIGTLLATCKDVSRSDATFRWADAAFLEASKVSAWSDMPVWLPPAGETAGASAVSARKAIARGLTFRPLAATVEDTLAYWRSLPAERRTKMRAGISPEREAEVLRALDARAAPPTSATAGDGTKG